MIHDCMLRVSRQSLKISTADTCTHTYYSNRVNLVSEANTPRESDGNPYIAIYSHLQCIFNKA